MFIKKTLLIVASLLVLAACGGDDEYTPYYQDVDWADQVDMDDPVSNEIYTTYGKGIIMEFNLERDIKYMATYVLSLEADMLAQEEKAGASTYVKESLFSYFTNAEFVKKYFPNTLYLAKAFNVTAAGTNYCPVALEGKYRVAEDYLYNTIHSIWLFGKFVMSVNIDTIEKSPGEREMFLKDNLFILLSFILEKRNLYDEFGDFYLEDGDKYYGRLFNGCPDRNEVGIWNEEGGLWSDTYAPASWYHNKGFVSTANMNMVYVMGGERLVRLRQENNTVNYYMRFPHDRKEDLRWFIDLMMYIDRETYDLYPEIVKNRFKAVAGKFDQWGFDFRRVNPVWNDIVPR